MEAGAWSYCVLWIDVTQTRYSSFVCEAISMMKGLFERSDKLFKNVLFTPRNWRADHASRCIASSCCWRSA